MGELPTVSRAEWIGAKPSAAEILAAWIAEFDTSMFDTPSDHDEGAQGIIASLERYGFVIVNPSQAPAAPFASAYAGSGVLRIVEARGEVIRKGACPVPGSTTVYSPDAQAMGDCRHCGHVWEEHAGNGAAT